MIKHPHNVKTDKGVHYFAFSRGIPMICNLTEVFGEGKEPSARKFTKMLKKANKVSFPGAIRVRVHRVRLWSIPRAIPSAELLSFLSGMILAVTIIISHDTRAFVIGSFAIYMGIATLTMIILRRFTK